MWSFSPNGDKRNCHAQKYLKANHEEGKRSIYSEPGRSSSCYRSMKYVEISWISGISTKLITIGHAIRLQQIDDEHSKKEKGGSPRLSSGLHAWRHLGDTNDLANCPPCACHPKESRRRPHPPKISTTSAGRIETWGFLWFPFLSFLGVAWWLLYMPLFRHVQSSNPFWDLSLQVGLLLH